MNKLVLAKAVYTKVNIEAAIEDYSHIAKIKLRERTDSFIIVFDKCEYDISRTKKEFENYLIGLENS